MTRRIFNILYKYVGADEIRQNTAHLPPGNKILSINDIDNWIRETKQKPDNWRLIPVTFVIDWHGYLRIADRHSEHIAVLAVNPCYQREKYFFKKLFKKLKMVRSS